MQLFCKTHMIHLDLPESFLKTHALNTQNYNNYNIKKKQILNGVPNGFLFVF